MIGRFRINGGALKGLALAATLAFATAPGATPGAAQELTKVGFTLLTQPYIWDAGTYSAIERGYFKEEGLELELVSPQSPADGLRLLASGGVHFVTAHSTEVITARSRGLPVVSVGTNHQVGTAGVMMPIESGVTELKQLEGKTLGITGIPFNQAMLNHMLRGAGVDVDKVQTVVVGFTPMPLLLSKRIDGLGDAITWSETAMYNVQIDKPATDTSTYTYFAFYEHGVPRYYTFGVVTSEDILAKDPELVRKFLRAWSRGQLWAFENQEEALAIIRKTNPQINEEEGRANLVELARISQSDDTAAHGFGWQDIDVWTAQEAFMRENGLIEEQVDVTKAMTNDYLPSK